MARALEHNSSPRSMARAPNVTEPRAFACVSAFRSSANDLHVSEEFGINKETIRQMLHEELMMRKLCAKLVPKTLTTEQKELRRTICEDFLERTATDGRDWLSIVITGNKSWVFQYDPETRRQSKQWVEADGKLPRKARMSHSQMKTMLICFFDIHGVVHKEFVPQGQTVNAFFYQEVLQRLCARVARVRKNLTQSEWILHHDNAPAHTASRVFQFLEKRGIATLPHPPTALILLH